MASQFYVSGPAYLWAGIGASKAFKFVGFSEDGVTVEIIPSYEDINVDYAGMSPGDVAMLGLEAKVSCTLKRYDETVLNTLTSYLGAGGTIGQIFKGGLGSLVHLEGLDFPLLTYSPYSFKPAFSATMLPGFNFYSAYFVDPARTKFSIRTKAPEIGFRCIPVFGTFISSTFTPDTAPWDAAELFTNTMPSPLPTVD